MQGIKNWVVPLAVWMWSYTVSQCVLVSYIIFKHALCLTTDATDEKPREESSDLIKEEDSSAYRLVDDVGSTLKALSESDASVKKPQERHTTTPVRPSTLMHHLNATTRGQNGTSGGMD